MILQMHLFVKQVFLLYKILFKSPLFTSYYLLLNNQEKINSKI